MSKSSGITLGPIAGGIITLLILIFVVALGALAVGPMIEAGDEDVVDRRAGPNVSSGNWVSFENTKIDSGEIISITRVNDSTGNAVNLTGADDSYVQSQETFTIASDETWTVCTWARVDSGAESENMTALSANGRVLLQFNGSQKNWSAWYFDEASRNSWRVNVSAPNQPGNYSSVCAWHNTTHLSIYRNTTQGDIVNTSSGSNIADVYVNSTNWNGRLDETRMFDDALNGSERAARVQSPIHPLDNATRTARIMYDEGSGTTTAIYWTGTSADLSNATWDVGLQGNILSEGTDYEINATDGTIQAQDGERIDGAPVAWVFYRFEPATWIESTSPHFESALVIATVSVLILPLVAGILFIMIALPSGTLSGLRDMIGGGPNR